MRRTCLCLVLLAVSVSKASSAELEIVALGASNTDGYGVGRGASFPSQLERSLRERGIDARVRNEGRSGEPTWSMLDRLDAAVFRVMSDWLFSIRPATIYGWAATSAAGSATSIRSSTD